MKKGTCEKQVPFSAKSVLRTGEIIFDDEIPCGDEIRLRRAKRTDFISSAKQISSERSEDFIVRSTISLKHTSIYDIIHLINWNLKTNFS